MGVSGGIGVDGQRRHAIFVSEISARHGQDTGLVIGNDGVRQFGGVVVAEASYEGVVHISGDGVVAKEAPSAERNQEMLGCRGVGGQRGGDGLNLHRLTTL
ncbi:hypothetical protein CPHO_01010 [Corynebacterium phocae]|uniref:Uncharacterized protein n=1 Tax=Corynebacterium phocae TaxID=161895 RepID=A0A1L7D0Q8_9CORY|nr:hypothetical protein CPHO_01010 [Corynebacterium phocae]